ncbi:MAG: hypothetical protein JRJ02_14260 [Deltaproteobacteria bacterium]|nr:hypothetical protein [Deltaproteobacteria bacterium]
MSGRAYAKEPIITPQGLQKIKVVTISDKAEKYNFIFVGEQRFRVSSSAIILDYGKKPIHLRFLAVPCKAEITYRLFGYNRDPLIEKIQLK